ncbi:MAG: hypothetical protein ACR2PR_09100 [Pseudohongiellaceae bacterium]
MDIGIINFLGIRKFVYQNPNDHGLVVRIVGGNAQGKSSVLLALGACLTQNNNPRKVVKTRMGAYGHNASPNARAKLRLGEHWCVEIIPGQSVAATITNGFEINPEIAKVMAGLADTTTWGQKDYVKIFDEVSIDEPAFIAAVFRGMADWKPENANNPESAQYKAAAEAYRRMKEMKVDGAIEHYESQARDRKADWRRAVAAVGESLAYGKKVAANWTPPEWLDEWRHLSIEDVQQEVAAAQRQADSAKMITAYDEGRLASLRELAAQCDDLAKLRDDMEKAFAVANKESHERDERCRLCDEKVRKLDTKIKKLRESLAFYKETPQTCPCPHCGKDVVVQTTTSGHKLAKIGAYDNSKKIAGITEDGRAVAEELRIAKLILKECQKENEEWHKGGWLKANNDFQQAKRDHDAAVNAAKELAAAAKGESEDARAKKIAAAENDLTAARDKAAKISAYQKAAAAHKAAERTANIAATMKPGGTVSAKLSESGMGLLVKWLEYISKFFGYKVQIDKGTTLFGDNERIAGLNCSESENWICRTMTQIAMGCAFGNRAPVLIDRVDVLDEVRLTAFLQKLKEWPASIQTPPPLIIAGTERPGVYDNTTADVVIKDGVVVNEVAG